LIFWCRHTDGWNPEYKDLHQGEMGNVKFFRFERKPVGQASIAELAVTSA